MFSFQSDGVWENWLTQVFLDPNAFCYLVHFCGFALFVRYSVGKQAPYVTIRPVTAVAMATSVVGIMILRVSKYLPCMLPSLPLPPQKYLLYFSVDFYVTLIALQFIFNPITIQGLSCALASLCCGVFK